MCGIVGYIGKKQALPILLQGLRSLEYRGYDSAGLVLVSEGQLSRVRAVGKVDNLAEKTKGRGLKGELGIAHTRWATHGGVTEQNAHPHFALENKIAVVHNGIIENYRELKEKLKKFAKFETDTDTEVLAHLIAYHYSSPQPSPLERGEGERERRGLAEAVRLALKEVRGTYGILVVSSEEPDRIVAARFGSPLVIGYGDEEHYMASDITPLLPYTKRVTYLDDGELAEITRQEIKIFNLKDETIKKGITEIDWDQAKAQKAGFDYFMLKEIFDEPQVFEDAIRGRVDMAEGTAHLGGLNLSDGKIRDLNRIVIIASGTALHAGLAGKYAFERLAGIPTEVDFSSEFRYRDPVVDKNTLVFVISQSGETADTLMAAREAKRKGAIVRGIVNVIGSTIARETGAGTYIHAGPELAVASTKAYTNMVAVLILYALQFGRLKHVNLATGQRFLKELLAIPEKMNQILKQSKQIERIATKYLKDKNFLFLGRGVNYPVALEGSLKLKEISYIHSEAYPAGEMKHGPLAIVEKDFPVVAIATKNQVYEKVKSNIEEVRARGAKTLIIASEGDEEIKEIADDIIYVPKTLELLEPLLNTIPLQLFAYYVAAGLKLDVDRPRNLAKSVTVE